jgi:hypothetical protein
MGAPAARSSIRASPGLRARRRALARVAPRKSVMRNAAAVSHRQSTPFLTPPVPAGCAGSGRTRGDRTRRAMHSLHHPANAGTARARAGLWAAACVLLLAPAAAAAGLHAAGAVAQQATAVKAAALTAPSKTSAGELTVCSRGVFLHPLLPPALNVDGFFVQSQRFRRRRRSGGRRQSTRSLVSHALPRFAQQPCSPHAGSALLRPLLHPAVTAKSPPPSKKPPPGGCLAAAGGAQPRAKPTGFHYAGTQHISRPQQPCDGLAHSKARQGLPATPHAGAVALPPPTM